MIFFIRFLFYSTVLLCAAFLGAALYVFSYHRVDFAPLAHSHKGNPCIVLDDQGHEWARFALDQREPIPLERMPLHLRNAFIAAEDWHFFSHAGISYKGIVRSCIVNLWYGRKMQGASTITQQLVKLLFFDSKKTFSRKIKEQVYAVLAEQQFTKEQILETYLNHVYFGCGIYGVEAASQRFWNKHAVELTLDECATLAAIIRCPAQYCPILYPANAQSRRNVILNSMKKLRFITEQEYQDACAVSLRIKESDNQLIAAHAKELIRVMLEQEFGREMLYTSGLTVQTTLNKRMQELAEKSFKEHIAEFKKTITSEIDGALITLAVGTGEIKALVGGFNFSQSKFNRAIQAKRQIGSVFKPLLYATAIKNGMSFADTEIDEPITIEQHNALWQPHNYNNKFDGQMTLAHALARSNNIVAVKTLLKIGAQPVIDLARACHIKDQLHPYPSLALGCVDVSLKEAAGMFALFAHNGVYVEPYLIKSVKDSWGKKIWKQAPIKESVLSEAITHKVAKVLELSIKRWNEAYKQELMKDAVMSKTGTTNDSRTCWFAGSTPDYTTVVYIGCDDNRSMPDVYPLKTAFPIWLDLHNKLPQSGKQFTYDSHLKLATINRWTGYATSAYDPDAIEIFI